MCQPLIFFASICDSGCLNNSILKSTHQILGLTIACQPLATCIFPSVLNAACICVTKTKISMSKNNIYHKNPKSSHIIDCMEVAARPACTLRALFFYLNSCWDIQEKKATSFPHFPEKKKSKLEYLSQWQNQSILKQQHCAWPILSHLETKLTQKLRKKWDFTDWRQPLTLAQLDTDKTPFNYQLHD